MRQGWEDVAFLHWRYPPQTVARLLPTGLAPDVFDGGAWVGLTPFRVCRMRAGPLPPLPRMACFPEANVRGISPGWPIADPPGHSWRIWGGVPSMGDVVLLHCQGGRREDARRRLDREVRTAFADVPVNNTWLLTLTNWASVSATLDEVGAAEILFDVLTPYAEQVPLFAGVANGAVALYLGMLATTLRRYDQAESYFSSAAAFHDRIRAPVWLAHTGLEWGRMLLTRSRPEDADRARDLLAQALATARALGLANVERRVVELLS